MNPYVSVTVPKVGDGDSRVTSANASSNHYTKFLSIGTYKTQRQVQQLIRSSLDRVRGFLHLCLAERFATDTGTAVDAGKTEAQTVLLMRVVWLRNLSVELYVGLSDYNAVSRCKEGLLYPNIADPLRQCQQSRNPSFC